VPLKGRELIFFCIVAFPPCDGLCAPTGCVFPLLGAPNKPVQNALSILYYIYKKKTSLFLDFFTKNTDFSAFIPVFDRDTADKKKKQGKNPAFFIGY
jgi:hypothetical protein